MQRTPQPEHELIAQIKKDEDAEFSDHSDSWEVISRTSPSPSKQKEQEETHLATDNEEEKQEQQPAVAEAAPTISEVEEEEEGAFTYTSTPEEIHSDADTYRTDDLFRQGDLDFYEPSGLSSESSPAGRGPAGVTTRKHPSPEHYPSCTPTEDEDFLKIAAAIMSEQEHRPSPDDDDAEDFDNAEEIALHKYVVAPTTAAAAALVGAAQALTNATGHFVVSFADRLRLFAAKFRAYVTNLQPAAHRLAGNMASTVHQMARSLHVKTGPGVKALSFPLTGAGMLASDVIQAVHHVACTAATRARKGAHGFSFKDLDWVKVGLAVGCAGLLGMLWKVNAANARLTCRLVQREGELAELVSSLSLFFLYFS